MHKLQLKLLLHMDLTGLFIFSFTKGLTCS